MTRCNVAVVGLGYVGLPLALEFGRKYPTVGYDLSPGKIAAYQQGKDPAGEVASGSFNDAQQIKFTHDASALAHADFIVVAVPTPVDTAHQPDFAPLLSASAAVGVHMKKGAT